MKELAVILPAKGAMPSIAALEAILRRAGLRITMRGTLSQYLGCVHWHLKLGREPGVLELTRWPEGKRIWFSMQDGRRGEWVMKVARELKGEIEITVAKSKP